MRWSTLPGWKQRLVAYGSLAVSLYLLGFWMTYSPAVASSIRPVERDLDKRLRVHVAALAESIGERNFWSPSTLSHASTYITTTWSSMGLPVSGRPFVAHGVTSLNLDCQIPGLQPELPIVLVGAHYDSVMASPGADDNASGVAVMLELSRLLKRTTRKRTIRFCAFANEEPPSFQTADMGSRRYAAMLKKSGAKIKAMLSLESLGYFTTKPGSQKYPRGLSVYYPDTGDFLAIVGNVWNRGLTHEIYGRIAASQAVPVRCATPFEFIPGVTFSDHASFWDEGYPAVMLTDTAPYRNPNYHTPFDRPSTLDYGRMAQVATGIGFAVESLADE